MGQPRVLIGLSKQYPLQPIDMPIRSNLKMLREFLLTRKKWWLSPILLFLLLISFLLVMAQGSVVAPFIYTLF